VSDLFSKPPPKKLDKPPPAKEEPSKPFVLGEQVCAVCGSNRAFFGSGVELGKERWGTWHCYEHWPRKPKPLTGI
jgi:hypothetical protein